MLVADRFDPAMLRADHPDDCFAAREKVIRSDGRRPIGRELQDDARSDVSMPCREYVFLPAWIHTLKLMTYRSQIFVVPLKSPIRPPPTMSP